VWGHNYARLASATMFSLFFGGRDFAPNLMIENVNIQDYLQTKYCQAMAEVARYLRDEKNVVGFDTLNEPSNGYIGYEDISNVHAPVPIMWDMSPFALMTLAAGFTYNDVPFYSSPMVYSQTFDMNPKGISAWKGGAENCIWRKQGVWNVDPITKRPVLLRPDFFRRRPNGSEINFMNDYMVPFFQKFETAIRKEIPNAIIFAEPHINIALAWKEEVQPKMPNAERYAWAPHYYDLLTLLSKSFRKWIVVDPLAESLSFDPVTVHTKMIVHQLEKSKGLGSAFDDDDDDDAESGSASLIGETGICFDHNDGEAYATTPPGEILALQTSAYDTLMAAIDAALASVTLWNYTPDNTNLHGDGWNEEDLSLFSYDQQHDPDNVHSGGRGLPAVVRPYASRISGVPLEMKFVAAKKLFKLKYDSSTNMKRQIQSHETVVFVPQYQYGGNVEKIDITVTDGRWRMDVDRQSIIWDHDELVDIHEMTIRPKK